MDVTENIYRDLKKCKFKISTDSREKISGSIFFALSGEKFNGNIFIKESLEKGAIKAVTDDANIVGKNIYNVNNVLKTLQRIAKKYRNEFNIPIIVIGGSNGKTTSRELLVSSLNTKYITHSTKNNFNNQIGLPLSILSMKKNAEIGVFEIGANKKNEHIELLNILNPTHAVVTNNGKDHLEGFKSIGGVRRANSEIFKWARLNNSIVFVNKKNDQIMNDSKSNTRIIYPDFNLLTLKSMYLSLVFNKKTYNTKIVGDYNIENVELAVAISQYFNIKIERSLNSISKYKPLLKRSQLVKKNGINFIVDCYNSNPSSLLASLKSFKRLDGNNKGLIIGDMLELGRHTKIEHENIVKIIKGIRKKVVIYIGNNFKKFTDSKDTSTKWFSSSNEARDWFWKQNFKGSTFLLKGSRGMKLEKVIE